MGRNLTSSALVIGLAAVAAGIVFSDRNGSKVAPVEDVRDSDAPSGGTPNSLISTRNQMGERAAKVIDSQDDLPKNQDNLPGGQDDIVSQRNLLAIDPDVKAVFDLIHDEKCEVLSSLCLQQNGLNPERVKSMFAGRVRDLLDWNSLYHLRRILAADLQVRRDSCEPGGGKCSDVLARDYGVSPEMVEAIETASGIRIDCIGGGIWGNAPFGEQCNEGAMYRLTDRYIQLLEMIDSSDDRDGTITLVERALQIEQGSFRELIKQHLIYLGNLPTENVRDLKELQKVVFRGR